MTTLHRCESDPVVGRVVDVRIEASTTMVTVDVGWMSLLHFASRTPPTLIPSDLVAVARLHHQEEPTDRECRSRQPDGDVLVLCSSQRLGMVDDPGRNIYVLGAGDARVGDVFEAGNPPQRRKREMLITSPIPNAPEEYGRCSCRRRDGNRPDCEDFDA